LPALVFGQGKGTSSDPELTALLQQTQRDKKLILALIHRLNREERCVGIIIQLPLPPEFQPYKNELLSAITPAKDLDGLNGTLIGKNFLEMIDFLPATPKAVISLLDYYKLGNLRGKRVAVL
jgi:bifunctional protein folD